MKLRDRGGLVATLTALVFWCGSARADSPLDADVGTWDAEVSLWIQGPDQEPIKSKGTETNKRLGESEVIIGDFSMDLNGQPFQGHAVTRYDSATHKVTGVWADTMSPEIVKVEGSYDPKTKRVTVEFEGPGEDGKPMKQKHETTYNADGSRHLQAWAKTEGAPDYFKMMEIRYTKKK